MSPLLGNAGQLFERDAERAALAMLVDRGAAGAGQVVVVEGPGGIGKSRLLRCVADLANERHITVGNARGTNLERDYPYGAVRQLLEPLVASTSEPSALFAGPAAAARAIVTAPPVGAQDLSAGIAAAPPDAGAVLEGLYRLARGLAERAPLVLLCDDVHWFDGASLRFLVYLAHRLPDLPCVLVIGTRPPEPGPEGDLLNHLTSEHRDHVLRPRPLSASAVGLLVGQELGVSGGEEFCDAVATASGGNPFLVVEVARWMRARDIAPDAMGAQGLAGVSSGSIVAARLGRLSPDVLTVARAVAVLGRDAELRHVAALASVTLAEASALADELMRSEVLELERPLSFVHPLVAAAVYNDLLPGERSRWHRSAADALEAAGAPVTRVASHLLCCDAMGSERVALLLVEAARASAAEGASDAAVALLRRALDEPVSVDRRQSVLLELGSQEALLCDARAADHLGSVLAATPADSPLYVPIAIARAVSLVLVEEDDAALRAVDDIEAAAAGDPVRVLDSLAASVLVGGASHEAGVRASPRRTRLLTDPGARTSGSALTLGLRAYVGAMANEPAAEMADLATQALARAAGSPEDPSRWMWSHLPLATLIMADRVDPTTGHLDAMVGAARRSGAPMHAAASLVFRGWRAMRTGDLDSAEADALDAIEALQLHRVDLSLPGPVGLLVDVARERGDLDRAESLLTANGYERELGSSLLSLYLLRARGLLRLAQGRHREAVADLDLGRAHFAAQGGTCPGFHAWGAHLAVALAADPSQMRSARDEARTTLAAAEAFGAPRAIGIGLLAVAEVEGGDQRATLQRARGLLAAAGDRLGEATATIALGRALLVHEGAATAVPVLAHGHDEAVRAGATPLAEVARAHLRLAGVRRPRAHATGPGALTPSEAKVVALARGGATNRGIAHELNISLKTVETHLGHAYRKLGICTRAELAAALR